MDSDEWGRGEGWGLMEGEGVLLGRRRPCAHSHRPVHGRSLCMGGVSSLSKGSTSLVVGWVVVRGCWVVDCSGWGSFAWGGCSWVVVCRSWMRW